MTTHNRLGAGTPTQAGTNPDLETRDHLGPGSSPDPTAASAQTAPPTIVEVFTDYVCPFCYLVEPALTALASSRHAEIRLRPFELRPDPVPTLRPEDDYLPRVWSEAVFPMAARLGMPIRLPSISPQPRTEQAFLVLQLATEQGLAAEYSAAMFTAFFVEDRDIGQTNVIVDIAASVGLDPAAARAALADSTRRAHHRREQRLARETIGITSVPSIRINGTLLPGVPSAARLLREFDAIVGRSGGPGGAAGGAPAASEAPGAESGDVPGAESAGAPGGTSDVPLSTPTGGTA